MKVSNNALNFLLAQYRAIFKRAYIKGLASAVLLTASLAVGQAQAAIDNIGAGTTLGASGSVTVTGTGGDKFNITGPVNETWDAKVTITGGDTSTNIIKANDGNVNLSGTGSLTISTSDVANGLGISGGTGSNPATTTVKIDSIDITKGKLAIVDGKSGSVYVAAGKITIGNSETAVDNDATLTLSNLKNKGATLGHEKSEITVNGDGTLEVTASGTFTFIQGSKLDLNAGAFMLVKNVSSQTGTLEIKSDDFTIDTDAVHVISGDAAITTKFTGTTGLVKGNLFVDNNGVFDISTKEGKGTVTLASGSNTVVSGSINVNDGSLIVNDGAILQASKAGATIKVNGVSASSTAGTLQISKDKLKAYLKGGDDNKYFEITAADGSVADAGTAGLSGAVVLSGGTLHLTDDKVDLATDFHFSGHTAATAGLITIHTGADNSTIVGKHLTLSTKLTKGDNSTAANTNTKLVLEAETLTLGKEGTTANEDFGFLSATAQNFEAAGTLVLKNQVNLSAVEGEAGTIKGSFTISGNKAFTIEHGSYTNDGGTITVSGGTLAIKNSEVEDTGKYVNTIWKVSGKLDLQAADNSTLEINGGNADDHGAKTVLDITGLGENFKVTGGTANKTVAVNILNGGTLRATGDQLTELLHAPTGSSVSGAKVLLDGGFIKIEGDATLASDKLKSGAASSAHTITFQNDGTLEVENTLTINNVTSLNIGPDGKIVAGILNLNGADADTAATLLSGNYVALNSLTSTSGSDIDVGDTAKVSLGSIDKVFKADGTTVDHYVSTGVGSLNTDLKISKAKGSVTVAAGDWSGSNKTINVAAGHLYVGSVDTTNSNAAYLDADGEAITASLTLGTLSIANDAHATVRETGTLTVNTFSSTGAGAFTVNGTATINGQETKNDQNNEVTGYGVTVGANSVVVAKGGVLKIQGAAVDALKYTGTSGSNGYIDAGTAYVADSISVAAGATVSFAFDSGTSFSADALKELRTEVFKKDNADGTVAGTINLGQATISGITLDTDGKYDWDKLQEIGGDVLTNFTFDELKAGVVKNVNDGDQVRGHFGALESSTIATGGKIEIVGNSSLNNAPTNGQFATGMNGALLGLKVVNGSLMELNNGGAIGDISLDQGSTLAVNTAANITNPGKTTIAAIDGSQGVAEFGVGEVEVTGKTTVSNLVTSAQGVATFGDTVTVGSTGNSADLKTDLLGTNTFKSAATFNNKTEIGNGSTATFHGAATFNNQTEIGDDSTATFNKGVTFNAGTSIYGDTTVSGGAKFGAYTEIGGNAVLNADSIELDANANAGTTGIRFTVGEEDYIDDNGDPQEGSTGYLQAASFKLAGNTLVVDPSYKLATSVAAIEGFADAVNNDDDAGTFNGKIFVGQNAALGVGQDITIADVQSFIKQYQNSNGSLIQDQVGSVMYIGDMLTAADGSRIILDSQHTQAQVFEGVGTTPALIEDDKTYWGAYTENSGTTNHEADLYLGQNTILAVSDNILADGAAVRFEKGDAAIMAQKVTEGEDAAKIVLDGNGFLGSREVTLFTDNAAAGGNNGVKVLGDQDIRVETLNGVMYFMLEAGTEVKGDTLKLDTTKLNTAFLGATAESRELLFAYTSQTENFREFYADENQTGANAGKVAPVELHGDVASSDIVTLDPTTGNAKLTAAAAASGKYDVNNYVVVLDLNDKGEAIKNDKGEYVGTVYNRAHNDLLEAIVRNTNGAATDSAALQGVFGGAAQAALLVARTSQEAVAGRTGVGASSSALTFADNGQGAGLWVNPIYLSSESDGFEVDNKEYGVDIDLYGVALGGDYTLANGVRVGAFFNVGSGEADGNGQASGVSNDFDYYGVGLYAGYSVGQFSIVGDVSYSVVDSEIDASTAVGKITSSFDTENLSIGVTGQYEFDFNGTLVTPHVGLRYSALSVDDYSFTAADYTQGGDASIDDANVFSIPVGVTVAKEFAFNTWTVKPSLDVTVQGNFGDDELDSTAEWDNVAWQSNYSSEFIDNFTYGATLGVAAKTGSFSAGIGLGYQGSSNTDEFSATANARFVF